MDFLPALLVHSYSMLITSCRIEWFSVQKYPGELRFLVCRGSSPSAWFLPLQVVGLSSTEWLQVTKPTTPSTQPILSGLDTPELIPWQVQYFLVSLHWVFFQCDLVIHKCSPQSVRGFSRKSINQDHPIDEQRALIVSVSLPNTRFSDHQGSKTRLFLRLVEWSYILSGEDEQSQPFRSVTAPLSC